MKSIKFIATEKEKTNNFSFFYVFLVFLKNKTINYVQGKVNNLIFIIHISPNKKKQIDSLPKYADVNEW